MKKTFFTAVDPKQSLPALEHEVLGFWEREKIFEESGIQEEMDAYNPLIPDGSNWKATMMIEYEDLDERKEMLGKLIGVEERLWAQVDGQEKVYPIADEDLERETEVKTSAVHFLRFELSPAMIKGLKQGAGLSMGVDHAAYQMGGPIKPEIRESLVGDLNA